MLRRVELLGATVLLMIAIGMAVLFSRVSPTAAFPDSLSVIPRPTATSTPASTDEPSPPGGLGNSRDDLESVYGSPTGLEGTMTAYRDGKYAATYVDERAMAILVNYQDAPLALAAARKAVHALLPSDSVFVGTLSAGPSRIADVYQSSRLGEKVAPPTEGVPRGQFAVIYETDRSDLVRGILLRVGRLPSSQSGP
jgi:hypothetical protein